MWILKTLTIIAVVLGLTKPECNAPYACVSSLNQNDCAKIYGYLMLDKSSITGNCCPTCGTGLPHNAITCNTGSGTDCAPGLKCIANVCVLNKDVCTHTYHLSHLKELPACEIDGTFAAKQCKGDRLYGRCFCYSEQGQRIYGFDWWRNADNMTCGCSRQRARIETQGKISTLHCTPNGNYEPLQCESGICWCADRQTGRVANGTRAVPDHLWQYLSCYSQTDVGATYMRQCESVAYAQNLKRKLLGIRGTSIDLSDIICDYDGRYGYFAMLELNVAACTWLDGSRIPSYQAEITQSHLMTCNCARDIMYFKEAGLGMRMVCDSYGNYMTVQNINQQSYCVDMDGYAVSDLFDTATKDCNQYLYNQQQ